MSERAKLLREITRASLISSALFIVAAAMPFVVPLEYETYSIIVMATCIALATWQTVKLQRLKKRLQTTPS